MASDRIDKSLTERERLQQAIALQESLRGTVDDAVLDSTIAALREKLAALETPAQQRKLATILFMDIAGHTALVRDLDPEENMAIIDPAVARLARLVEAHGGHLARYQGDGFKAVFGLPVAQENDPDNAVRAGLAILGEAERIEKELKSEWNIERFKVRVGIDTGLVLSGGETEGQDTIKGAAVNLAARLESAADPGTLVISQNTYQHVRGAFRIERLPPFPAKGFPEPLDTYRVLEEKARSFRTRRRGVEGVDTRMIGRAAEFQQLQEIFYTMLEERERQVVTLVGEAGVGKSRLLYEFESWVDLEPITVRLYRGRAHYESRRLPYGLLHSIFMYRFEIQEDDPAEMVREKWMAGFLEAGEPGAIAQTEMRAHILGQLLGIDFAESPHVRPILQDPQQIRDRSLVYLLDYFQAVSRSRPVLILLEDLHWADDSSLDVLSQLGVRLGEAAVMVVGAARPGLYERRPYWFEGRDFHHRVNLKPLSRRASRELVKEVLQRLAEVPDDLTKLIVGHAAGNPFYVEELVKVLVEAGVIVAGDPDWRVDHGRLAEIEVPSTLTGVLQARLERLPEDERTLIQQASVVGRVFWDQAIGYLNGHRVGLQEARVETGLSQLRARELIYRRELSTFVDSHEYLFKHAVLREVTYQGVLKRLRRVYHRLVAEWLIEQRGERTAEIVGLIAGHLEQAGEQAEALHYLRLAGDQAAARYAHEEAVDYYGRALALVEPGDLETRWRLHAARERAYDVIGQLGKQAAELAAMEELAQALDENLQLETALRRVNYWDTAKDYPGAHRLAEQALALARQFGDRRRESRALGQLGYALWRLGRARQALLYHQQALGISRDLGDQWAEVRHLGNLGNAYELLDRHDDAVAYFQEALALSKDIGDRTEESRQLGSLGRTSFYLGEYWQAQEYERQALSVARAIGNRIFEGIWLAILGYVSVALGEYGTAGELLRQSLDIFREVGSPAWVGSGLMNGSVAYHIEGKYIRAFEYGQHALAKFREVGNRRSESMTLLNLGEAAAELGQLEAARDHARQAVRLAETLMMPSVLLECRAGLARAHKALAEWEAARDQVETILAHLDAGKTLSGTWSIVRIFLTCYQVLQETDDPRAARILESGHALLQERAAKIPEENLRRSFLENVPWHREIVRLWEAQRTKT